MQKRYVTLLAALLAVLLLVPVSAAVFSDVPDGAYYADAAERMAAKGYLSGYGDGIYGGDDTVTRAHIAALVCKLLDKVDEAKLLAGETAFSDVPATHWSSGYVNYAAANKIIVGDGDGKFRPDDPVRYEEVVKVLVCILMPDTTFKIDPADWSKEFLAAAANMKLLNNLIGKKGEPMKRSDIAVITDAAVNVIEKTTETSASSTQITTERKPVIPTEPAETVTEPETSETEPEETVTEPTETSETTKSTGPIELPIIKF